MKHFTLHRLCIATTALLMCACSGKQSSDSNSATDRDDEYQPASVVKPGNVVKSFKIDEDVITASRLLCITSPDDTTYLKISTSVQWPVKLASFDIKPLQDALLGILYPAYSGSDIAEAANAFTTEVNSSLYAITAGSTITEIDEDKAPYDAYFFDKTATIKSITSNTATFEIVTSMYSGGAHPNSDTNIFTYDLESSSIVTPDMIFKPGSENAIDSLIRNNLANQFGTTPDKLTEGGLLENDVKMSGVMYLGQQCVCFVYQPYEIAPYSMGVITANLYFDEIRSLLTPKGTSLLGNGETQE